MAIYKNFRSLSALKTLVKEAVPEKWQPTVMNMLDSIAWKSELPNIGSGGYAEDDHTHVEADITDLDHTDANAVHSGDAAGGDLSGTYPSPSVKDDSHTHDTRYYTESEVDTALAGKADAVHTHVEADITDLDHTDASAIHDNVAGEIAAITAKVVASEADLLLIEDAAVGANFAKKRVTVGDIRTGVTDADAIHDNKTGEIHAVAQKATPVDADEVLIEDSENSWAKKRVALAQLSGGSVFLQEQSADPPDPQEGTSYIWQSDGTASGDDGDILAKITAGGVTKTATLIDFSAI